MDVWMYGCMDVCMDGWMDACMDVRMYGCMNVLMYGCMDELMYGCMDVWMYVYIIYLGNAPPALRSIFPDWGTICKPPSPEGSPAPCGGFGALRGITGSPCRRCARGPWPEAPGVWRVPHLACTATVGLFWRGCLSRGVRASTSSQSPDCALAEVLTTRPKTF